MSSSNSSSSGLGCEILETYADGIIDIIQPTPHSDKIRIDIVDYINILLQSEIQDIEVHDLGLLYINHFFSFQLFGYIIIQVHHVGSGPLKTYLQLDSDIDLTVFSKKGINIANDVLQILQREMENPQTGKFVIQNIQYIPAQVKFLNYSLYSSLSTC